MTHENILFDTRQVCTEYRKSHFCPTEKKTRRAEIRCYRNCEHNTILNTLGIQSINQQKIFSFSFASFSTGNDQTRSTFVESQEGGGQGEAKQKTKRCRKHDRIQGRYRAVPLQNHQVLLL